MLDAAINAGEGSCKRSAQAFGRRHEDGSPQGQDPDSVGAWFTTAVPQAVPS